jgi:hypothetical protein
MLFLTTKMQEKLYQKAIHDGVNPSIVLLELEAAHKTDKKIRTMAQNELLRIAGVL